MLPAWERLAQAKYVQPLNLPTGVLYFYFICVLFKTNVYHSRWYRFVAARAAGARAFLSDPSSRAAALAALPPAPYFMGKPALKLVVAIAIDIIGMGR
jgi:hypothetical protein